MEGGGLTLSTSRLIVSIDTDVIFQITKAR